LIVIVGVLLLPALLIATWIAMWFVRKSKRWLYYFSASIVVIFGLVAVVGLAPRSPCESTNPAMCLDNVSVFGTGNTITGFYTWLGLLLLTGLVELVLHLVYLSRLRRTTDEFGIDHPSERTSR
jgi:bacteriorhodopsin